MKRDLFDVFPDLPWPALSAVSLPRIRPVGKRRLTVTELRSAPRHHEPQKAKRARAALGLIRDIAQQEYDRLAPKAQRQSVGSALLDIVQIANGAIASD
jgi:hypothetical protein